MRTNWLTGVALAAATPLLLTAMALQTAGVSGSVTAKGLRTNAGIVVSLQAPGTNVTPPAKPPEVDQKGMVFIPHVMAVVRGTAVRFLNSDAVAHNVFSPEGKYNLGTWPQGETREHMFDKPGVYTQLCRVHPEMESFVVVLETPYFAVSDREGKYAIAAVPPGKYTLVAWSERLKSVKQEVVIESGKTLTVDLAMAR
ncbi:MAG: carboxypeptidase regulatory-like domain-containing protein [Acidobacteriota bacterium]|nr:carboxypeptidase regulatory-like domain-containing protein [Acidobacteriota bacterium]